MPENINELITKAEELAAQEKFKKALEILEELYTNNPNSEQIKNSLIKTLFTYGGYLNDEFTLQYEEAKEKFRRIIEIDPENYRAHYNLGIANFNLEKIEQAKECYEKAIEIKPDYKHCFYNLGLIYEREGDLQKALKYYEKSLEIDPKFPYAFNARNYILSNLNELQKSNALSKNQPDFEKLKSLLEISKRIKIEMIQDVLNIDKDTLFMLLIEWGKKYQFEIDGEYLNINKDTLPDLLKNLEDLEI